MPPFIAILLSIAIITGTIAITIVITRDRKFHFFSRVRSTPTEPNENIEMKEIRGDFEQYGNLPIPPDRQPTRMALDIMTRILLATGLPVHTVMLPNPPSKAYLAGSVMESGLAPPKSTHVPWTSKLISSEKSQTIIGADRSPAIISEASRGSVALLRDADRGGQNLRPVQKEDAADVGQWVDVDLENDIPVIDGEEEVYRGDEEVLIDPMSFSFGSGRAMAGLYR